MLTLELPKARPHGCYVIVKTGKQIIMVRGVLFAPSI
jgi:hypothetical protein